MSSSQIGKTELLYNFAGSIVDRDPGPLLVMQPCVEDHGWCSSTSVMGGPDPAVSRRACGILCVYLVPVMKTGIRSELSNDALMESFQHTHDPDCFADVFLRHRERVFPCCDALLRNSEAAADLTQETFLRAMNHAYTFRGGSLAAWLSTVAGNLCLSHIDSAGALAKTSDLRQFEFITR